MTNGVRAIAFGDVDPVGPDGVIEERYVPVDADAAAWIDDVVAAWSAGIARDVGTIKLRARRLGQGVSSYAALRYDIVLEGPTAAVDDDIMIELKEERDGDRDPRRARCSTPRSGARRRARGRCRAAAAGGARQRRARRRGRGDASCRCSCTRRPRTSAASPAPTCRRCRPTEQRALAHRLGEMLARAHGEALTQDGVQGWRVIAPLIGDAARRSPTRSRRSRSRTPRR